MKVICINGVRLGELSKIFNIPASVAELIYEGEIYTVTDTQTTRFGTGYILEERSPNMLYNAKRFVPLSTIDETELIKERLCEV